MVVGPEALSCVIVSLEDTWVEALEFPRSSLFLRSPISAAPISKTLSGVERWSGELRRELILRQVLATLRAESDGRDPEHAPNWVEDAGAEMRRAPHTCRIDRLVEKSLVSRTHFSTTFRKRFGLKPVEYRTAHRLLNALHLLQHTNSPLAEIAQDSGFTDQSHLTRALRLKLGVTPNSVREAAATG